MKFLRDQLDDPESVACGRCDNCGGLALSSEVLVGGGRGGRRAAVQTGRAGVAAQDVAGGAAHPRHRPARQDRRGCGGGPGRRPAHRPRLRRAAACALPRRGRRTVRCRTVWPARWWRCSRTGGPRSTRSSVVESSTRPTLTADLATGLSRFLGVPVVGTLGDRRSRRRARSGPGQLGTADRGGGPSVLAAGRHRSRVAGAARRRPDRLGLDVDVGLAWRSARRAPPPSCRWRSPARHSRSDMLFDTMTAMGTMGNDLVREARKRARPDPAPAGRQGTARRRAR